MVDMIEGVVLTPLKHVSVPNGDVFHGLKSTDETFAGFGEAYFTQIEAHQIKGWKRHNKMTLNLIVVYGHIKFVVFDDRVNSPTSGKFEEYILSPLDDYRRLTVAPGLWMAFAGADAQTSMLLDIISEPHDPDESDRKELSLIPYEFNV